LFAQAKTKAPVGIFQAGRFELKLKCFRLIAAKETIGMTPSFD
jgi:hypothetical protein